jgi:DNA repair exonuclease SbcCD ATPase subunit
MGPSASTGRKAARRQAEKEARTHHEAAGRLLAEAQQQVLDGQRRQDKARADAERCAEACAQAYAELSEPFRTHVSPADPADWLATAFPSAADLEALKQKHAGLQGEGGQLDREAKALRQQLPEDQKEEKRLETAREQLRQAGDGIASQRAVQEALRQNCHNDLAAAAAEVPDAWKAAAQTAKPADLGAWQDERDALQAAGVEVKHRDLLHAGLALQGLLRNKQELEAQRDAIPLEARRPPEEVRRLLADAKQQEKHGHDTLVAARGERQRFLDRRDERRRLAEERAEVVKQLGHYQVLAKYLDRDYLQRHLMRQAERTIVAYARDILDRLSDGQIGLQQRNEDAGGADKALVLEAFNRSSTDNRPHRVEMLSGSERFRVAVSLALAIGQYASCQHRPIQSVIIDEGFGCLDPANRQLMIQELHNLQGQLHRILLVSHQEEFAGAFTNGYRFERENGATRVCRFSK